MDKKQAVKLISEIFESPFSKGSFNSFVRNLLNHVDDDGFSPRTGTYIPDSFMPYIHSLERVGKYMDGKNRVDILIVHLKKDTSLERARTMQRNFVAGYLQGKYGSTEEKEAALVAFVSSEPADWRFSLVKMEYRFEEDNGSVKVKEEFTPARRWSFLVGANERSHTAQSQLVPILADDENNPTLAELEEAFSIEKVSDEFFGEYRRLFIAVKEGLDDVLLTDASLKLEFETKNINSVDFAKKLLGQIIFLYYLQKKGWFGVPKKGKWGEGSKNFLREIFEKKHSDYENFFNDILEPLFYQALRTDRSYNSHYYDRFDCKIPFLNGGLFDPMGNYDWVETDICLPNALFSNEKRVNASDKGDGILDVFDRYNFTVREDEPFEKEVAIDPELLGKAYEKFNAIRPDNFDEYRAALKDGKKGSESKFNKKFGVYYTPREIVHYMCQQSLIQYLHTELNEKKSYSELGSTQTGMFGNEAKAGQLSMTKEKGMMEISKEDIEMLILHGERIKENDARVVAEGRETSTYSFDMPDSIRSNASHVDEALASVKVCDPAVGSGAFPVGMMNEIVKARDVLSIYTHPQTSEVSTYHFKRECIENSLYGVDIDPGAVEIAKLRLWLSLVVDEENIHNIKPLPNLDYKLICGNSLLGLPEGALLNAETLKKLEKQKKVFFDLTNPVEKNNIREGISSLFEELIESARQFNPSLKDVNFDFQTHFSEVFQEKDGFDVVIGNPPYLRVQGIQKNHPESVSYYRENFRSAKGNFDLYALFIERGYQLLNKQGQFAYIVPHKFFQAAFGEALRRFLTKHKALKKIVQFGAEQVFSEATTYTCLLFLCTQPTSDFELIEIKSLKHSTEVLHAASTRVKHPDYTYSLIPAPTDSGGKVSWNFTSKKHQDVLNHLRQQKHTLDDFVDKIFQGLATSADKIYVLDIISEKEKTVICYSNYIDEEIEIERGFVKPFLMGKDIHRYEPVSAHKVVIFPYILNNNIAKLMSQDHISRHFPLGWKYLKRNKTSLGDRERGRMHGDNFYSYIYRKNLTRFEIVKIVTPDICGKPEMSIDLSGLLYHTGTIYSFVFKKDVTKPVKFFLGLMNSKLMWYFLSKTGSVLRGGYLRFKTDYLKPFPIAISTLQQEKAIELLVDRILTSKRTNPDVDTSKLEGEIDALIYELYGLTDEEIAIVEGREVDSSAQTAKKKRKAKAPVMPVKAMEEKKAAPMKKQVSTSDYGLYKCSECGGFFAGYEKDEHVSKLHLGQDVEWLKMGGG
jgi:hypothetical protein